MDINNMIVPNKVLTLYYALVALENIITKCESLC